MRSSPFARSCATYSHDSVGILRSLKEALWVSLYRFFSSIWERFLHRRFSLGNGHQAFWLHGLSIFIVPISEKKICTLCIPAIFMTSMPGILSCHWMLSETACMEVFPSFGMPLVNYPCFTYVCSTTEL